MGAVGFIDWLHRSRRQRLHNWFGNRAIHEDENTYEVAPNTTLAIGGWFKLNHVDEVQAISHVCHSRLAQLLLLLSAAA
jgi:hypothetical protein